MKRTRILTILFVTILIVSLACNFTQNIPMPFAQPTATPMPLPAALVETDPPMGSQLGLNQKIIFYFNQPMDKASVVASVSGLPEGIVDWLDDSTMTFTPGAPYAAASGFTVQFNESAKAANGLALSAPATASFTTTDYLRLTQSLPAAETSDVMPASAVVASFNQPVVPLGSAVLRGPVTQPLRKLSSCQPHTSSAQVKAQ